MDNDGDGDGDGGRDRDRDGLGEGEGDGDGDALVRVVVGAGGASGPVVGSTVGSGVLRRVADGDRAGRTLGWTVQNAAGLVRLGRRRETAEFESVQGLEPPPAAEGAAGLAAHHQAHPGGRLLHVVPRDGEIPERLLYGVLGLGQVETDPLGEGDQWQVFVSEELGEFHRHVVGHLRTAFPPPRPACAGRTDE